MALVTCERPIERDEDLDFLAPALRRQGVEVETPAWSDPRVGWDGFDLVKLNSPWDYHERPEEFSGWLRRVARASRLQNPLPIVEWNFDKRYLRELDRAGIPTIATVWSEPGEEESAVAELERLGWEQVVIKPVIDASAMNLVRIPAALAPRMLERFDRPVLLQPYLPSVAATGELSLVYLDGTYSHALRKSPATGDFRVQPIYGGTHEAAEPSTRERSIADAAVAASPGSPLYARVDLVASDAGDPLVIELELIEPSLYLDVAPRGADVLAKAMLSRAAGPR